ncbi:MAG TPA: hypothetical protein K8U84_06770 [Paenalcaligenes hominis]|uniref:Pilus assembly protein n=2 Tax=Paenalcaligenes hominis TaxID=643674 RepID=A0A9D2VG77_9BURK|nr:hypothetical protein [Paenalcaligenes hominis]
MPAKNQKQSGQGMTEYVIIVALIAVAAIAVFQIFGQVIRSQTAAMAKELAGEDGTAESQKAQEAAQLGSVQAESKSLQNFTGNASQAGGN